MKFTYVKAVGYIGFWAKLGIKEVYIDFSKMTHNMIVIKGSNGHGKSTLINLLHILPDGYDNFIPKEPASKELGLIDNDTLYIIKFKSDIKKNGERDTTKAYISRSINGFQEELNPNGNVSSYKDLISTIFNLDLNFIELSKLTAEKRGLVDKTPGERKKFVNSIISNIEVYNNMHKILTKKSSIFKNMINNITSKLDSIGDYNSLTLSLVSLEDRINKLYIQKDNYVAEIAFNASKVQLLDPEGSIQSLYDDIYKSLVDINSKLKDTNFNISRLIEKSPEITKETITDNYNLIKQKISFSETQIKILESKVNTMLQSREDEAKSLQSKNAKLATLQMETNYTDLVVIVDNTKAILKQFDQIISKIGIVDIFSISKDEFILGLNTLKDIKETISILKSNISYDIIVKAISYMRQDIYPNIDAIERHIEDLKSSINTNNLEYQKFATLSKIAERLNLRPTNCNINTCSFIRDALDADDQNPLEEMTIINTLIINETEELSKSITDKSEYVEITNSINYLKSIIRSIESNASIINKLPVDLNIFSNRETIFDAIENGYRFDEIDILYEYIQYANIIEEYKSEYDKLKVLENDLKIYEVKNSVIDDIIASIDELSNHIQEIEDTINSINKEIITYKYTLSDMKDKLFNYEHILELYSDEKILLTEKNNTISKYNSIKDNMANIKIYNENVNLTQSNLDILNKQLGPLLSDRDIIKHSISLSKEYNEEMNLYNKKYTKVEILKKYSSPTKKGIQLLFIEIYMNKMLTLANQLLDILFGGEYVLKKFIINDSEFSIPCIGSRITCDDISSMSGSQKCMISMVLSFVLLLQSSTKYNILRLDEIDYALDTQMRLKFSILIDEIMRMLNVEQNFIISHNDEIDLTNCSQIIFSENGIEVIN